MPIHRPAQPTLWEETDIAMAPGSRPTEAAFWRGSVASRAKSREVQRLLGQFMTPPSIARHIANGMVRDRDFSGTRLRLLDPAAGSGVLAAALVEAILAHPTRPVRIELLLCDIDAEMNPLLMRCAAELAALCERQGVRFESKIHSDEFLLGALARSTVPQVDAVIANPPYFKLARRDPRALAHESAVHGQPNIYALFMAAGASLLRPGGAFAFITPRSWTNGAYFRALRRAMRDKLSIDALHLFDSRQAHFEDDAVLQEALITWGTAGKTQGSVRVSSSHGALDLDGASPTFWSAASVLGSVPDAPICLPAKESPRSSLETWPLRLSDLGLRVVTGPVVGFRAAGHLHTWSNPDTVPMLWMPHVHRSRIQWPRGHKAEHIERNARSDWMLLPNEPVVLLRRFSPKEDARRVTAAAYEGGLPGARIGFENHLNVIRGGERPLSALLARGLSAWLNSQAVDIYLRQRLGSTQVNAVELRALPVPDREALESLGRHLDVHASSIEIDLHVQALMDAALVSSKGEHARAA